MKKIIEKFAKIGAFLLGVIIGEFGLVLLGIKHPNVKVKCGDEING